MSIEAVVGKRIAVSSSGNPSGVQVADFIAGVDEWRSDGQLWVVALGTNDVNQYSSPDEIAAVVNEMLDAVPDDVPLVWVDTYYRDEPEGAALFNAIVADRLSRRGNSVMAPWNAFAVGRRDRAQRRRAPVRGGHGGVRRRGRRHHRRLRRR